MKTLIFYAADGTGSAEFKDQAEKIAEQYNGLAFGIKCRLRSKKERRDAVLAILSTFAAGTVQYLIFLCHGWPNRIQLGFSLRVGIDDLSTEINRVTYNQSTVFFGCCSVSRNTGHPLQRWRPSKKAIKDVGSFTSKSFADAIAKKSNRFVLGHYTAGHTTKNPFLVWHHRRANYQNVWDLCVPYSGPWPSVSNKFKDHIDTGDYRWLLEGRKCISGSKI